MKIVYEKFKRRSLNEGRHSGLSMTVLEPVSDKSLNYNTIMPLSACSDYLNDFLYVEHLNKDLNEIYGFKHEYTGILKDATHIPIFIAELPHNSLDVNFNDNYSIDFAIKRSKQFARDTARFIDNESNIYGLLNTYCNYYDIGNCKLISDSDNTMYVNDLPTGLVHGTIIEVPKALFDNTLKLRLILNVLRDYYDKVNTIWEVPLVIMKDGFEGNGANPYMVRFFEESFEHQVKILNKLNYSEENYNSEEDVHDRGPKYYLKKYIGSNTLDNAPYTSPFMKYSKQLNKYEFDKKYGGKIKSTSTRAFDAYSTSTLPF